MALQMKSKLHLLLGDQELLQQKQKLI